MSEETKRLMGYPKGRKLSQEHKEKVSQGVKKAWQKQKEYLRKIEEQEEASNEGH